VRRALTKAEADVKKLKREAFEAAVVCICQEAEQEAAEYIKEALGLETRYKRRVALNAMLQTTGKKFDLDLGRDVGSLLRLGLCNFFLSHDGFLGF
jgi:hypothetical protein